jgi:hypothetical protein
MTDNVSSLSTARIKKMTYMLLPGNGAACAGERHDLAYQLWKNSWQKTYSELKTAATLKADDFTRQDIISVLFDGGEAVGLMLHTHYNLGLEAIRDHSYFSSYPAEVVARLRAERHNNVLSFEYLTLGSKWRKALVGTPVSKIISGLSAKIVETLNIDAIAVTRVDRRVNEIFAGFGAHVLVPNLTLHNVAVHLMKLDCRKIHSGPDPEVNQLVDHLWRRRTDLVGLERIAAAPAKKAA